MKKCVAAGLSIATTIADECRAMMRELGRRRLQHLVEGEAYRRIMAGEAPATLNEFVSQLSDWVKETFPTAPLITPTTIESQIRETWQRRHELIRGGDC